jgi:hypothetical protein
VDCTGLLLEDETLVPRVMGCRRLLAEWRAFGLIATCLRRPQEDWSCISHGSGSFRPATGEPRMPLRLHGIVAELEFIPGQHFLLLQLEHEHGRRERREAKELLG